MPVTTRSQSKPCLSLRELLRLEWAADNAVSDSAFTTYLALLHEFEFGKESSPEARVKLERDLAVAKRRLDRQQANKLVLERRLEEAQRQRLAYAYTVVKPAPVEIPKCFTTAGQIVPLLLDCTHLGVELPDRSFGEGSMLLPLTDQRNGNAWRYFSCGCCSDVYTHYYRHKYNW